MDRIEKKKPEFHRGCIICGKKLVYQNKPSKKTCSICHKTFWAQEVCEDGHYVCDDCHAKAANLLFDKLLHSSETDYGVLMEQIWEMPQVHLHGPEHHRLVPAVLITAYCNQTGREQLKTMLEIAWKRGEKVPGGTCGYWGICGSAVGAGIFFSIILENSPMTVEGWSMVQHFTSRCLEAVASYPGPRCCKRTGRLAMDAAAQILREISEVEMKGTWKRCSYADYNQECLRGDCPFYLWGN